MKIDWKLRRPAEQQMQQTLFADRLKVKVHYETREMPIFALAVAKGGLKMHEAKAGDTYAKWDQRHGRGRLHGG